MRKESMSVEANERRDGVLTGRFSEDAKKSYKTVEGRALCSAVREALRLIDLEMHGPSTDVRGKRIAEICNALELVADRYELFGEKDRRRKVKSAAEGSK